MRVWDVRRLSWLMLHAFALSMTIASGTAAGQVVHDFEEIQTRLQRGDHVLVMDDAGGSSRGVVDGVSTSSLRLLLNKQQRVFEGTHVLRIDRLVRDSVRNGALWGLAVGAGAGLLGIAAAARSGASLDSAGVIVGLGLIGGPAAGAAIGAAVDASVMTQVPVYDRRTATSAGGVRLPLTARPAQVLAAVSVRF